MPRCGASRGLRSPDVDAAGMIHQHLEELELHTRDQLIDAMYRDERVVSDRTMDSHIKKIRRKISVVLPDREIVHSVYGLGYKYEW